MSVDLAVRRARLPGPDLRRARRAPRARARSASPATSCARPAAARSPRSAPPGSACRAALASPLGDDPDGRLPARARSTAEGVALAPARAVARTPVTVVMPSDGERAMATFDPGEQRGAARARRRSSRARSCCRARPLDLAPAGAARLRDRRRRRRARARRRSLPRDLSGARALLVNAREARLLTGAADAGGGRARGSAERVAVAIVTLGADGALAARRTASSCARRGVDVEAVDTTGAGDLFAAAYVWADLAGADAEAACAGRCSTRSLSVTRRHRGRRRGRRWSGARGGGRARARRCRPPSAANRRRTMRLAIARRCRGAGARRARRRLRHARRRQRRQRPRRPTGGDENVAQARRRQGRRRHADRLGPGGPRRPERRRSSSSTRRSRRSTRTSRSSASRSRSTTSTRRSSSRSRAPRRRTSSRPTRAARSWASSSRAACCAPLDAYADAYGWERPLLDACCSTSTASPPTASSSARATSTASRRWARSSASSTTRTRSARSAETFAEFEAAARRRPRAHGDVPIQFGNLDKFGRHPRVRDGAQTQYRRQAGGARLRVRHATARPSTRPSFSEAADEAPGVGQEGLLHAELQRHRLRPRLAAVRQGQGPFLIAGTWLTADLAEQMGDKVGFMLMPGADAGEPPVSLGGESLPFAITSKSKNPDVAAAYIDFLTNAERRARCWSRPNNLPAMKADAPPPPSGAARRTSSSLEDAQRRRRADPVPRLHDADVLRRHLRRRSRSCWPARHDAGRRSRRACRRTTTSGTRVTLTLSRDRRRPPPGEPRRVGYLYLLPAFARLRGVRAGAARARGVDLAVRLGRADGRAPGSGCDNYRRRRHRTRRCARRSGTRWCCSIFYAVLPVADRAACSRRRCRARACAGWRCSGRSCSCRR